MANVIPQKLEAPLKALGLSSSLMFIAHLYPCVDLPVEANVGNLRQIAHRGKISTGEVLCWVSKWRLSRLHPPECHSLHSGIIWFFPETHGQLARLPTCLPWCKSLPLADPHNV